MGYRLWDPIEHKIIRNNDVIFVENSMQRQPKSAEGKQVVFEEIIIDRQQNEPIPEQHEVVESAPVEEVQDADLAI
eukprot:c33313_g1_i1 orf=2-226(-)